MDRLGRFSTKYICTGPSLYSVPLYERETWNDCRYGEENPGIREHVAEEEAALDTKIGGHSKDTRNSNLL